MEQANLNHVQTMQSQGRAVKLSSESQKSVPFDSGVIW